MFPQKSNFGSPPAEPGVYLYEIILLSGDQGIRIFRHNGWYFAQHGKLFGKPRYKTRRRAVCFEGGL